MMARAMMLLATLGGVIVSAQGPSGLLKEQAEVHWKSTNIGEVKSAVFFQRQAIMASESTLSSVNVRNGTLLWRRPLGAEVVGMDLAGSSLAVVTEDGILRLWQAHDGALVWDVALSEPADNVGTTSSVLGMVLVSSSKAAVAIGSTVIGVHDGDVDWSWTPPKGTTLDSLAFNADTKKLLAICIQADGAIVAEDLTSQFGGSRFAGSRASGADDEDSEDIADPRDGDEIVLGSRIPSGLRSPSAVVVTAAGTHAVATAPTSGEPAVQVIDLSTRKLSTVPLTAIGGLTTTAAMSVDADVSLYLRFVIRGQGAASLVDIGAGGALSQRLSLSPDESVHATPVTVTAHRMATSHALITSPTSTGLKLTVLSGLDSYDHHVADISGGAAFMHVYLKKGGLEDYRVLLQEEVATGGRAVMVGKEKEDPTSLRTLWEKETLLAGVVDVLSIMPKSSTSAADGPAKFIRPSMAGSATLAVSSIMTLAKSFPSIALSIVADMSGRFGAALAGDLAALTKKQYTGERSVSEGVVVAATETGWLFGMSMHDGKLLWKRGCAKGAGVPSQVDMYTVRPCGMHAATVALVMRMESSTVLLWVEPVSGAEVGRQTVSATVTEVAVLPVTDALDNSMLGVIDSTRRLWVMGPDASSRPDVPSFFHAIISESGGVVGYQYDTSTELMVPVWRLGVGAEEKMVAWKRTNKDMKVAGATHVTGSRSILHKYINQNMIAVVTSKEGSGGEGIVTLYLVDGVSGKTLHRSVHPHCSGRVHLAMADNDVWMTFWNEKWRMNELVSMELYEKRKLDSVTDAMFNTMPVPTGLSNMTHYDSKDRRPPQAQTHRYFVPAPVSALSITATKGGIASRQLLVGLSSDQVLAVDRRFINPRSPKLEKGKKPTAQDMEEMLMPYDPMLKYIPTNVVTYENDVRGLRRIVTSPGTSESISNMVVIGDDLLFVPLTPSGAFDSLGEEFNKPLLVVALSALSASAFFATAASRQKMLKAKWQ